MRQHRGGDGHCVCTIRSRDHRNPVRARRKRCVVVQTLHRGLKDASVRHARQHVRHRQRIFIARRERHFEVGCDHRDGRWPRCTAAHNALGAVACRSRGDLAPCAEPGRYDRRQLEQHGHSQNSDQLRVNCEAQALLVSFWPLAQAHRDGGDRQKLALLIEAVAGERAVEWHHLQPPRHRGGIDPPCRVDFGQCVPAHAHKQVARCAAWLLQIEYHSISGAQWRSSCAPSAAKHGAPQGEGCDRVGVGVGGSGHESSLAGAGGRLEHRQRSHSLVGTARFKATE
eukprot:7391830-Prymnesium_polylepis.2